MTNNNEHKNDVSRRKFLKGGALLATTLGLSTVTSGKTTEEVVKAIGKTELDTFPHKISSDFERYDQRRVADLVVTPDQLTGLPGFMNVIDDKKPGYTSLDYALMLGASSVDSDFAGMAGCDVNTPMYPWYKEPSEHKYKFASKEDAAKAIKKAAKFYGADLVGITSYDEKWVYNPMFSYFTGETTFDNAFPFKPKSVIVMAFEMDYEGLSTGPSTLSHATTMLAYSKMAETNYKLTTFMRGLGYKTFGVGNDTALSVPYAIAAGLGEQGRQGLLITYEYGPRVRICKVFTEMDLAYDKPIKFGANDFCKVCKKCATSCPSQSISHEDNMTWGDESNTVSNHTGVFKYYVNVETCYIYWNTCGNDCTVCIGSCPYNKPNFWHHRITTALTATPLKPFLNEMDDLFGYGNIFDEKASIKFWDLDSYAE